MKYLILLLLVSCASTKPNCTTIETGKILHSVFSLLECSIPIVCDQNDTDCQFRTECIPAKNKNGKYICIHRD